MNDPERVQAVADAFTAKYGTATRHVVAGDGAFSHAEACARSRIPQGRALQPDDLDVPVVMSLGEPVQAAIDALIASGE